MATRKDFQFAGEGVNIRGGEWVGRDASPRRRRMAGASRPYLGNASHNIQHVQCPAPKFFGALLSPRWATEIKPVGGKLAIHKN